MNREALSLSLLMQKLVPVARAAGELIMTHYQGSRTAETKEDRSPVTQADREADMLITRELALAAPDIAIVSEEGAKPDVSKAEYFWLVDPLDGTRSFVRGSGFFTVNIGLIGPERLPIAGIIYDPVHRAMYWGYENTAFRQRGDEAAIPIAVRTMNKEPVAIISHRNPGKLTEAFLASKNVSSTLPCASSIKFCRVAEGVADLYPRFGPTMEWDTAAGHAILLAAGGSMTTTEGAPYLYGKPRFENGNFIACSRVYIIQSNTNT